MEGLLARFVWRVGPPLRGGALDHASPAALSRMAESTALAADLKSRAWRFVGPRTVDAFVHTMGLVRDHLSGCRARIAVACAGKRFAAPGW